MDPTGFSTYFRNCSEETVIPIQGTITGKFPEWIDGSLVRNSPGRMEVGQDKYQHWFDGLSLIHRFNFTKGEVTYQNKFLETNTFKKNMKANRIVMSEFGTAAFPDPCATLYDRVSSVFTRIMTDNVNVNVVQYGDGLYAVSEFDRITRVDPETLETKGMAEIGNYVAVNIATVHPHVEKDGTVYNLGNGFTKAYPTDLIIKFPAHGTTKNAPFDQATVVSTIPCPSRVKSSYHHSFAMTENYFVIIDQSFIINFAAMACAILKNKAFGGGLQWDSKRQVVFKVVEKATGKLLATKIVADPIVLYHHVNAYEEDGHIIVDACCFVNCNPVEGYYRSAVEDIVKNPDHMFKYNNQLLRFVIPIREPSQCKTHPKTGMISLKNTQASAHVLKNGDVFITPELISTDLDFIELPAINYELVNGVKYKYSYGVSRLKGKYTAGIAKVDMDGKKSTQWEDPTCMSSEPVFLQTPGTTKEDEGVLLFSVLHLNDEKKVSLIALNAQDMSEMARVSFSTNSAVPNPTHGRFLNTQVPLIKRNISLSDNSWGGKLSARTASVVEKSRPCKMETNYEAQKIAFDKQRKVFKRNCKEESAEPIAGKTLGAIPKWLKGNFLRNGPGITKIGEDHYNHPFDGLSTMHCFHIDNGDVTYRSKFLRSDTYEKNMKANRIVVSEFGTAGHPDPCSTLFDRFKSVFKIDLTDNANINIFKIGDGYYASTETNLIRRVDPETLDTREQVNLGHYLAINTSTAHPHIEDNGTVFNLGSSFVGWPSYNIVSFPPQGKPEPSDPFERGSIVGRIPSGRSFCPSYYHSFAMTENYFVHTEQSLVINIPKLLWGKAKGNPLSEALQFESNQKVRFHVVDRATGEHLDIKFLADPFMLFHHCNAYEEEDKVGQKHIIIDLCAYDNGDMVNELTVKELEKASVDDHMRLALKIDAEARRFVLPLGAAIKIKEGHKEGTQHEENLVTIPGYSARAERRGDHIMCQYETLTNDVKSFELPQINYEQNNAKKHRYIYGIGRENDSPDYGLIKIDTQQKSHLIWTECNRYPSEPVFVPCPGATEEDQGILLSSLLHEKEHDHVSLLVVDAKTMKELGRSEFKAKSTVTMSFHGPFIASQ